MTQDRARKQRTRTYAAATGTSYTTAQRQLSELDTIMEDYPRLCYFGMGVFDELRKTPAQREGELAAGRTQLRDIAAEIFETAEWLRDHLTPIKTPGVNSYRLKHIVERALGRYVTNGEVIAAALIVGYPHHYLGVSSPNLEFGISARDLKRYR